MIVRDRMVRGGIVSSQRLAKLSWVAREFFRNLFHVCDDAGRFEANPALLRAALFGADLQKVSERDVQGFMVACHQAGLLKLYTVEGRGYGEVLRFGQEGLRTRRVIYPAEGQPTEEALPGFGLGDADPPPRPEPPSSPPKRAVRARPLKEGRKEESPQPPTKLGGEVFPIVEARKASRRYRSAERAEAALTRIETALTDILRPGGCAHNVQPTGPKLAEYERLMGERKKLKALMAEETEQRITEAEL